jgi:hypothetical protein
MKTEYRFEGATLAFFETQYSQLAALQQGINGALALILSQNALEGQWSIDWPNRRMIRVDAPPAGADAAAEDTSHEFARNGR